MTTTLGLIHRELSLSLVEQLTRIEAQAELAENRLDEMVDDFETQAWIKYRLPRYRGFRPYAEQRRLYEMWKERRAAAVPVAESWHFQFVEGAFRLSPWERFKLAISRFWGWF